MLYLLDANTLIDAEQYYYGFQQVPQFWVWLLQTAGAGHIKMPYEVWAEITPPANHPLGVWINDSKTKELLILEEQPNSGILNNVIDQAYAPDLSETEIELIGADPLLVAYALINKQQRVVVTKEVSKTTATRGKRKLPDACNIMGVQWTTDFALYKMLGFKAG